jgi:membrane-associated protein
LGPLEFFIDFIIHIDTNLLSFIQVYGLITYLFIFTIIFCETGLVLTPFFPGDSLIFVAGAIANNGQLNLGLLFLVLCSAAIIGDTANYSIGYLVGPKLFKWDNNHLLKKDYMYDAQNFFVKHGRVAIILARFVPVIRTFIPFVAGIGTMPYKQFIVYNVVGGVLWVALFLFGGYFFGGFSIVRDNLSLTIIAIVIISIIPALLKFLTNRNAKK